jgi:hypothetical protein
MILKKGPLPSMPGNLIGEADTPEMEGVPRKFQAQIPQIPPEENFSLKENEQDITEWEDPPIGHIQNPLPAAEGVTIQQLERSRKEMQRCLELHEQQAKVTVSYFNPHETTAPRMC